MQSARGGFRNTRHSRESGNPFLNSILQASGVDSHFRGNDMLGKAQIQRAAIVTRVRLTVIGAQAEPHPERGFPLSRE
jgi:hypothetical protein